MEIGEYSKADINFLLIELWQSGNSDNYAKCNYLAGSVDDIEKTFGYHPLSISYLIDKGFGDITELVKHPEMEKYLGFYRGYFERNRPEAERLLALEFPFSQEFLEKEFPAGFVDLVKNELLILKKAGGLFSLYRVITTYFKEEFALKGDNLGQFAYQFIEGVKGKRYKGDDGLNVFIILLAYLQVLNDDNKRDKNLEAAVVSLFNGLEGEIKLRKESVDSFASNLAGFQLETRLYAQTLNNLGILYWNTGRFGDAGKAYKDAEGYYRELAASNRAAYLPALAGTLYNLGLLYADTDDRLTEAETHFKEALPMYESIKAHGDLIKLYPRLIDVIQKARNSNLNDTEYSEITGYLCNFLEIYDIFLNEDRQKALGRVSFFREQKTFDNLDINKIRANIKYPVHQSRFDSLLRSIKAGQQP